MYKKLPRVVYLGGCDYIGLIPRILLLEGIAWYMIRNQGMIKVKGFRNKKGIVDLSSTMPRMMDSYFTVQNLESSSLYGMWAFTLRRDYAFTVCLGKT